MTKFYVVSESELEELAAKAVANYRISMSTASYTDPEGAERRLNEAEAACRARPVEKVRVLNMWAEVNEE